MRKICSKDTGLSILDFLALMICAWAEFGFAYFARMTAHKSLQDPMERYCSQQTVEHVFDYLTPIIVTCSFMSAALTIMTLLNPKKRRQDLVGGYRSGIKEWRSGKIGLKSFIFSTSIIMYSFAQGSIAPWTGFNASLKIPKLREKLGTFDLWLAHSTPVKASMFLGEMVSYMYSNASYLFSAARSMTDFMNSSRHDKWKKFTDIFDLPGGWRFFISTIVNVANRSWRYTGVDKYTCQFVLNISNKNTRNWIAIPSGVSTSYATLMTQSIDDYKKLITPSEAEKKTYPIRSRGEWILRRLLTLLLMATFFIRAIGAPSLYTGHIENPAQNYGYGDLVKSILGFITGLLAAYQYYNYANNRGKEMIYSLFSTTAPTELSALNEMVTPSSSYSGHSVSVNEKKQLLNPRVTNEGDHHFATTLQPTSP